MTRALVRSIADSLADGELTHLSRQRVDLARARRHHDDCCAALRDAGAAVEVLPADEAHPDCVFIEDTAVVLPDVAVLTRPGAESRRAEPAHVKAALERLGFWLSRS